MVVLVEQNNFINLNELENIDLDLDEKELLKNFLINANKNINSKLNDKDNLTLLMYFTDLGNYEVVDFLIKNQASLNLIDSNGDTALYRAIRNNRLDIVKLLLKFGADFSLINNEHQTAALIAKKNQNLHLFEYIVQFASSITQLMYTSCQNLIVDNVLLEYQLFSTHSHSINKMHSFHLIFKYDCDLNKYNKKMTNFLFIQQLIDNQINPLDQQLSRHLFIFINNRQIYNYFSSIYGIYLVLPLKMDNNTLKISLSNNYDSNKTINLIIGCYKVNFLN